MSQHRSAGTPSVSPPTSSNEGVRNGSRNGRSSSSASGPTGRIRTGGGTSLAIDHTARIPLHRRDGTVAAFALIDAADYEWLSGWHWSVATKHRVAARREGRRVVYMHRQILGLEHGDGLQGEHKNRDPLDNRRSNLRVAQGQDENMQNLGPYRTNRSGYRGVSWDKRTRRWMAKATVAGKQKYLGRFVTAAAANAVVVAYRAEHMPFSEDAACEA